MRYENNTITKVSHAEEYFKSMGCSHFHMAREYPERYAEYTSLKIDKQTERQWRIEERDRIARQCMICENDKKWWHHSRLADLVETLEDKRSFEICLEVTAKISYTLPGKESILVAETLIGRSDHKYRKGPIYRSYDLNFHDIAESLISEAENLIPDMAKPGIDEERCKGAINDIKKIKESLLFQ